MTSAYEFWEFSRSSIFTIKLQVFVTTTEFNPASLLITNRLAPVAINLFPAPQQALWFYNSYGSDIELKLTSRSPELVLVDGNVVVKSHQHTPLCLTFAPTYVGVFEVKRH